MHRLCLPTDFAAADSAEAILDRLVSFFEPARHGDVNQPANLVVAIEEKADEDDPSSNTGDSTQEKALSGPKTAAECIAESRSRVRRSSSSRRRKSAPKFGQLPEETPTVEASSEQDPTDYYHFFTDACDKQGTVKLNIQSKDVTGDAGSGSTFRDAHVEFQATQLVIRAIDESGRTWTRFLKMPCPISTDESRFQVAKTGTDVQITLKKAQPDDIWVQNDKKLAEKAGGTKLQTYAKPNQEVKVGVDKVKICSKSTGSTPAGNKPGLTLGQAFI
mmetsp:Transcript_115370/g.246563  ORF Transcript_115370/g.246563 Transcript_115370/m.246563 type:complete len:275 (-) Transcript_115370:56-880(-)|eukprot:CAMPEP_0180600378 /NCGR_PEP_ID=MMETSP1037_2-20121125/23889_1 /TAXON_ID=632150 /ORGANISM="Azadinium spinosum, Strain 3D9" /LENGTH=274 /DNA_ID=CAMNT_0022619095 /DNA_START=97 /DNA_END=921 /DNA_ORIENTATION=+